ncbi:bifunctional glucose-1-phosphatase/inositol phosphatase [Chimaeribacter californicus]|uniref:Bifunctional glucose-1-phosphatase/inositol phosphatase n=1 Tax=Chimaeribacter californicus TaxID=2060067 RepID=A0A2N5DYH5_9GAMM|nr:bifunctional glucose-1-phosphatase/inositol phosphatase [Chimaeribacter californicus]PLR32619.1 bifunctional glucose-1-phosphatase/inositol phosphatase [Chimaeribacter californicus]
MAKKSGWKKGAAALSWLLLPLAAGAAESGAPAGYTLEKVVIMSRHGIRAPLVNYGDVLAESTPHTWPAWKTPGGLLTPKGGQVEEHVGRYFRAWLGTTGLLAAGGCPAPKQVFTYANSLPRTIDTATHFLAGAFPGCDVRVTHQMLVGTMDPTFNPIITADVTDTFRQNALRSLNQHAGEGGIDGLNQRLKPNYAFLEQVLDYRHSKICREEKRCSLAAQPSSVQLSQGKEPGITGPLRTATGAADAFMLQYYEGYPLTDVAWGKVSTPAQWQQLEAIKNLYHETLFGSPAIAANAAAPLLGFISQALDGANGKTPDEQAAQQAKVAVLVGHDSNIASLLAALGTQDYQLPQQYERTPISGAVVFQRWHDSTANRDLLKVEYVYPTTEQIRNNSALTLQTPPQRVTLKLAGCPADVQGFCPIGAFRQAIARQQVPAT